MGELILCRAGIAAMPYYIESISLNIYSLEELCYYIQKYIDRIDEDFWTQELFEWIGSELSCKEVAQVLREQSRTGATVAEMVETITDACGFFRQNETREMLQQLRELENKSEFEKSKLRADRYLKNRNYAAGIGEYRRLLRMTEKEPLQALETGSIWHNLGVANAQMFLYRQAVACFQKAYEYNNNPESLMEMYFALQCIPEKENIEDYEPPKEWQESVRMRLQQAVDEVEDEQRERPEDARGNAQQMMELRIAEWKNEYRLYSKL